MGAAFGLVSEFVVRARGVRAMPLSRCNILIVEDQAIIALDLESAVEKSNGQVIGPASTVREALKLLHTNEVDAAILDANLPDGDVTPVAEQLIVAGIPFSHQYGRRRSPPASTLPWSNDLSEAHALVAIDPRISCAPAYLHQPRGVVAHSRERVTGVVALSHEPERYFSSRNLSFGSVTFFGLFASALA
jgi:CheY-like chemotaxis protein